MTFDPGRASSSAVEAADEEARRGVDQGAGPQLSGQDLRRLHPGSHSTSDSQRADGAPPPPAVQPTAHLRRIRSAAGQVQPRV